MNSENELVKTAYCEKCACDTPYDKNGNCDCCGEHTIDINETAETIENLLPIFYSLHAESKRLEDEAKGVKEKILKLMGENSEIVAGDYKAMNIPTTRKTLVEAELKKFYNLTAIDESCYKTTNSKRFTVDKFVD